MTTRLITQEQEEPPTSRQVFQLGRFVEDAVNLASLLVHLDRKATQRLIANGGGFQRDILAALINRSLADPRFELLSFFEFTVPRHYDPGAQLDILAAVTRQEDERLIHSNAADLAKDGQGFIPGRKYFAKLFGIRCKQSVSSHDCLGFLASQRAMRVGAQGLSLVLQLKKDKFPVGKWTVSFPQKDILWLGEKCVLGLPAILKSVPGSCVFRFLVQHDKIERDDGYCLLCVTELMDYGEMD